MVVDAFDPVEVDLPVGSRLKARMRIWQPKGASSLVILSHIADRGMDHPFSKMAFARFAKMGCAVASYNFPYMCDGRELPDRRVILDETLKAVIQELRSHPGLQSLALCLGGISMGARIVSDVVGLYDDVVSGMFFFGYPFQQSLSISKSLEVDFLRTLSLPALFVHGREDHSHDHDVLSNNSFATSFSIDHADHTLRLPQDRDPSGTHGWITALDHATTFVKRVSDERSAPRLTAKKASRVDRISAGGGKQKLSFYPNPLEEALKERRAQFAKSRNSLPC